MCLLLLCTLEATVMLLIFFAEFTKTLPAALETVSARDTSAAASAEHSSPSNSRSLPRDTKPEQEKHLMEPSTPPNIRRFTMVDPLMKPM